MASAGVGFHIQFSYEKGAAYWPRLGGWFIFAVAD